MQIEVFKRDNNLVSDSFEGAFRQVSGLVGLSICLDVSLCKYALCWWSGSWRGWLWLFCDIFIWLTNTQPALTHTSWWKAVWTLVGWFVQPGPHLPVHRNALSGDSFPEGGAELIWWLKWECFVLLIWDPSLTPPLLLFFFYHNSLGLWASPQPQPPQHGSQWVPGVFGLVMVVVVTFVWVSCRDHQG